MKIIKINDFYKIIKLVPRVFPNEGDEIVVKMRNELTNIESLVDNIWYYDNNYFTIQLGAPAITEFFLNKNKYELTIYRNCSVIYKGRVLFVDDNEDIQNYTEATIIDNKIKF